MGRAEVLGSIAGALLAASAATLPTPGGGERAGSDHVEARALTTSAPQSDRNAPPDVPPVEHRGIRYEQDLDGAELGGRLAAFDAATGKRLWTLDVYHVPDNEASGVDAIGRYFRRMAVAPDGWALMIEDETGARFSVDLTSRRVTALDPPRGAEDAPPLKPKPQP
jgi:hypothetical protein